MAQKVFYPTHQWLTKDAITFMVKHLTLSTDQKKELESDQHQDKFFKRYEHMPGYNLYFDFKMQASLSLLRAQIVHLFKLIDEVSSIRMEVEETIDACEAAVIGKDHVNAKFFWLGARICPYNVKTVVVSSKIHA